MGLGVGIFLAAVGAVLAFAVNKDVSGVKLPHHFTQSVDGKPTEEWTVSEFKVNPNLKPETFVKKSS